MRLTMQILCSKNLKPQNTQWISPCAVTQNHELPLSSHWGKHPMAPAECSEHIQRMNAMNDLNPLGDRKWGRSQWSRDDLEGKTVSFSVSKAGHIHPGTGSFAVYPHPQDCIEVEIVSEGWIGSDLKPLRIPITPKVVSQIQRHPTSQVAAFQLLKPL